MHALVEPADDVRTGHVARVARSAAMLAALLVAPGTACPTTTDDTPAPVVDETVVECTDATCDRFAVEYLVGTWARGICAFPFGCCSLDDRVDVLQLVFPPADLAALQALEPELFNDEDACTRAVAVAVGGALQDDVIALFGGRRVYDRERAAQCLAPLDAALTACAVDGWVATLTTMGEVFADRRPDDVCAGIFAGTAAAGGACRDDGDCVNDGTGLGCETPSAPAADGSVVVAFAGQCVLPRLAGEACAVLDDHCAPGLFCAPPIPGLTAAPSCVPRTEAGGSCAAAPCVASATCDPATATCVPRRPPGAPCAVDDDCTTGTCRDGRCLPDPTTTPVRVLACTPPAG